MPYASRVWYISEFFEEISEKLKNYKHIDTLSIHMNTVDNWFKRMEKEKIHFLHRDNFQKRIYDDTDLIIACYLYIETKINKKSIGTILKYRFTNIKTRTSNEAKLSILETNKEAGNFNFSDSWNAKPVKEKPSTLVKNKNLKFGDSMELMELLKKEVTFNGHILSSNEKQRIIDFLSGLI
nr:hypothetical protein [Priestia megaterium]